MIILSRVDERNIATPQIFPSMEAARQAMAKELADVLELTDVPTDWNDSVQTDGYIKADDFDISGQYAWANDIKGDNIDWVIQEIVPVTGDNRVEFFSTVIDIFDTFLEDKKVSGLKAVLDNEEKTGDECESNIYGSHYSELEELLVEVMQSIGVYKEVA